MTKAEKKLDLGTAGTARLVLGFALTALAGLILNTVYNLTDALFLSWGVGDDAMGGVSIIYPFVILQSALSATVGGGAAALVSRRLGEGKPQEAGRYTLGAMAVFYAVALTVTAIGLIFTDPLLSFMGATDKLYPFAKDYFIIILAGNVFSTGFSSIIRAEGRLLYGAMIWIIPITLNIALDAVFIFVFKWGAAGSAASTVISQFMSFLMCVLFFTRFSAQRFKGAWPKLINIAEIAGIGVPSLVQTGSLSVTILVINNLLRETGGTMWINSFAYVSRLITYLLMPLTALTMGVMPVAGYNYGAKQNARVKKVAVFICAAGIIYAAAAAALTEAAPALFMRLFTNESEIIDIGVQSLRIIAIAFIFQPLPMMLGAVFQSTGKKLYALMLYGINIILFVPLAYIMSFYFQTGGLWWAYVIAAAGAAAASLAAVPLLSRHLRPAII